MTRELIRQVALWVTFICGLGIAWSAVCRLNASTPATVRPRIRAQFSLLLGIGVALALSPWIARWQVGLIVSVQLLVYCLLGMGRWRDGVPPELGGCP